MRLGRSLMDSDWCRVENRDAERGEERMNSTEKGAGNGWTYGSSFLCLRVHLDQQCRPIMWCDGLRLAFLLSFPSTADLQAKTAGEEVECVARENEDTEVFVQWICLHLVSISDR